MVSSISSMGGYSSASQTQMLEKLFSKIDKNGDGKIDKDELTAFKAASQSGSATNSTSVDDIFNKLDTNQDGSISKDEFKAGMAKMRHHHGAGGPPPPSTDSSQDSSSTTVEDIFKSIDTDGDGTISKSEFKAALEKLQEQTASEASSSGSSTTYSADSGLNKVV
jgi:Ca2+-binding EF-hand superfamily protein